MTALTITNTQHTVSERVVASPNEWGGITRNTVRTVTTTITLSDGRVISRSHESVWGKSYDAEAQRINLLWLTGDLAARTASR